MSIDQLEQNTSVMSVDITPTPRILRILGEIPFQPWQCIAELVDNSIDSFLDAKAKGVDLDRKEISVAWSRDSVPAAQRTLEIHDTATGMTLAQLQNAVRAGYSSNDPVNNLGLFGMGFNIATARLGEMTEIYSTRIGDTEWVGLRIDFDVLNRTGAFSAPVLHRPKTNPNEHGTIITVSRLKSGIRETLSNKENEIRRLLQQVYSPLLYNSDITINVRGKLLVAQKPCVWDKTRYVMYDNRPVQAVIDIDHSFGSSFFDQEKNRYLTEEETDAINALRADGSPIPANIITREKRVYGWVGIQRYANPSDFGIDLIRNGRKILMSDKTFFSYENPWTNMRELQYPVELGSTVGGRIIGELHVDFLLPTYQKNDFDRTDRSWQQLVDFICGAGPYLPKARKAAGFTDPVQAPIPLLANAYRRCDPGTKCLYIPNVTAKQFLSEFRSGKPEYQSDELWFKAAQEEDQKKRSGGQTTTVNTGSDITDDIDAYLPTSQGNTSTTSSSNSNTPTTTPATVPTPVTTTPGAIPTPTVTSTKGELIGRANPVITLSGSYSFGNVTPFNVHAYELTSGEIKVDGESKPCFFENTGIDCTYIYNPRHPALAQYPFTPKGLLLQYLAERIKARDAMHYTDIVDVYVNLTQTMMPESRINKTSLQEKADAFFKSLRDKLADALSGHKQEVLDCIFESSGEVEETITSLFPDSDTIMAFQNRTEEGYVAIEHVPYKTLVRLVDRFPSLVFDSKVMSAPYETIYLPDAVATERMRNEAKDRMISFLKDALRMIAATNNMNKNELARAAISIDFLVEALV